MKETVCDEAREVFVGGKYNIDYHILRPTLYMFYRHRLLR